MKLFVRKHMCLIIIVSCVLVVMSVCGILYEYSLENKIIVDTEVAFVEEQFPQLEDIEEVKYYYDVKSGSREIGLQEIEFCGFIKIGEDFYKKITQEYDWKETKKAKNKVPKVILTEGENEEYHFSYNYEFSHDGKYKSHSWGGHFYLDKEKKTLYFECEW